MCSFPHCVPRGAFTALADWAALGRRAVGTHSGDWTEFPALPFGPARRPGRRGLRGFVRAFVAAALLAQMGWVSTGVWAAEFAQSTYLLGLGSSLAGFTPPPGFYFQADNYFYGGKIGGGRQISFGPAIGVNVRAQSWLSIPTGILVTPVEILGGNLAIAASLPLGVPSVNPTIQLDFPRLRAGPGKG